MQSHTCMKQVLIAAMVVTLSACSVDTYADKFQNQLAIGDSRNHAIEVMGPPSTVNSVEVPLLQLEQLAWKSANGRVYVVHTAAGRVVSKSVIQ